MEGALMNLIIELTAMVVLSVIFYVVVRTLIKHRKK